MEIPNSLYIIRKLKKELLWDDSTLMNSLELTKHEFNLVKNTPVPLKYRNLKTLSQTLNQDVEDIIRFRLDWAEVRKNFADETIEIDPQYTNGAGTYIGSIRSIFQYIENSTNAKTSKFMLDTFGLKKEILLDDNRLINLNLIDEILSEAIKNNLIDQDDIPLITINNLSRNKSLIDMLQSTKFSSESLSLAIAINSDKYEKNFSYQYEKLDDTSFLIKSKSRPHINEALGSKRITGDILNLWKKEMINNTFIAANLSDTSIKKVDDSITNSSQEVKYLIKKKSSHFFH